MRKIWKFVFGGIEQKIFDIFIGAMFFVTISFIVVLSFQFKRLTNLIDETQTLQEESVAEISDYVMNYIITNDLPTDTDSDAELIDLSLQSIVGKIDIMKSYIEDVLSGENVYTPVDYLPPDPSKQGQLSLQLLLKEGLSYDDPRVLRKIDQMEDVGWLLESMTGDTQPMTIQYGLATPEGMMLLPDFDPKGKYLSDGTLMPYDPTDKHWYLGAVEAEGMYFSDIEIDTFTGEVDFIMSQPVYSPSGELFCVIAAQVYIGRIFDISSTSVSGDKFTIVLNHSGRAVIAPEGQFLFAVRNTKTIYERPEMKELVSYVDAIQADEDEPIRIVSIGSRKFFVSAKEIRTTKWTTLTFLDYEFAYTQTRMMHEMLDEVSVEAAKVFDRNIKETKTQIYVMLGIVAVLGSALALLQAKRMVKPLTKLTDEISGQSGKNLKFELTKEFKTGDEIEVLATSYSEMTERLEKYIREIQSVTAEKERIGAELKVANHIQADMLPSIFPPYPERTEFDLYATMHPAKEVGGDFFDFFFTDKNHLALVMADVSGKGVPAALFMVIAKSLIKTRAQMGGSPSQILQFVNDRLCENNKSSMFVTIWLAIIDLRTGEGVSVNAGHEHPVLKRANGEYELVIYKHSPIVGMIEDMKYPERTFKLEKGDSIFVYTDGIPEAVNKHEKQYGTDRMLKALNSKDDIEPKAVLKRVAASIKKYTEGVEQFDDMTMLSLKYNGGAE